MILAAQYLAIVTGFYYAQDRANRYERWHAMTNAILWPAWAVVLPIAGIDELIQRRRKNVNNLYAAIQVALAFAVTIMIVALGIRAVPAEPLTTFRNDKGQVQGYGSTRGNTTTFSNEKGQQTGRTERRPDGSSIFFNEKGQRVGTGRTQR